MAFHVTQCPGCDSTFNTNARILQSAAGKVRCGACLTVFEAVDNFIAINDAEEDEDSSVFVGNDPADYFDPTQFITRSALTTPDPVDEAGTTNIATANENLASPAVPEFAQHDSQIIETAFLHNADADAEAISDDISLEEADFLTAVAEELEVEPAVPGMESETVFPAHDAVEDAAPYSEQELAEATVPLESWQEAQEELDVPIQTEAEHNEAAEPEPVQQTALATAAAQSLADQAAPEAIRLHASFSLYYRASEPAEQSAKADDVAVSAAESAIAAAPDFEKDVSQHEDNSLVADSIAVVPETVSTLGNTLDTESLKEAAEATDESSPVPSDQFVDILEEASADFELIDVDRIDPLDIKPGDDFELDDDYEATVITHVEDAIDSDGTTEHDSAATPAVNVQHSESAYSEKPVIDGQTDSEDSTLAIRARAFRATLHDDNALEALPKESRAAIGKVLPPLELLSGVERQWGRRIALLFACLILSALVVAQFLWQRLPVYSRMAEWRPVYEFACGILSCELPVYSEISALRSDNLVVRSHPTVANALTVSLSFRNTARFAQPFPVVILSFNSATNAIIALREFAPSEYLDVGLRDVSMMPVMTPVQIELEVMDPGADAVNYTVAFRRP